MGQLDQFLNLGMQKGGGAAAAGLLGGPVGMGLVVGGGLLQGFLGANQANKRFGEAQKMLGMGAVDERFQEILKRMMPGMNARSNALSLSGMRKQSSLSSRLRRSGLGNTGIGASLGSGIDAGAGFQSARLRGDMEFSAFQEAFRQQQARSNQVMGMLGTPFGAVSPMSGMLAGAGRGMEAWQMSRWAEQLAGRQGVA